jgi:hypothetical protein
MRAFSQVHAVAGAIAAVVAARCRLLLMCLAAFCAAVWAQSGWRPGRNGSGRRRRTLNWDWSRMGLIDPKLPYANVRYR